MTRPITSAITQSSGRHADGIQQPAEQREAGLRAPTSIKAVKAGAAAPSHPCEAR